MLTNWNFDGKFLVDYPRAGQGTITNWFCYAVRDGQTTVSGVLSAVEYTVRKRMPVSDGYSLTDDDLTILLEHLLDPEAEEFAAFILERESLPPEERERLKAASGKIYQQEYMASEQPTAKQLSYLKYLKCETVPASKLQASQLIDEILKAKK